MYIYFVLNHPAHYHLFKYAIKELTSHGHECETIIRPKDVLKQLVDYDGVKYLTLPVVSRDNRSIISSAVLGLIRKNVELSKYIIKKRPNLIIGTEVAITNVGRLFNIPSLFFNEDDTVATPENRIFYHLAKNLILPDCCDVGMWNNKRVSYAGYHELAYLHPKRFKYDCNIVKKYLGSEKPYVILRLVKLTASHDIGKQGLGIQLLDQILEIIRDDFQIMISFEGSFINKYEKYSYKFDPILMHHFLAGAHLVIGDSQTMIAEAAVLGTPALRFNDFVGKLGYLEELEHKYGLTTGIKTIEPEKLLQKIEEIRQMPNLKEEWQRRRVKMLSEKIDVTAFIVWFIENYPKSVKIMQENPDYQYEFK